MKRIYVDHKGPIAALLVFIFIGGVFSLLYLPTSLFPDVTFPKIKIIVDDGEQPVNKMMLHVTIPMENAIKKVQDLKLLRSTTARGSCEISAFMQWNSDIDLAKQRIDEQINSIKDELPPGVSIAIEKMNPSILQVMGYSIEGGGQNELELRQLAEYTVKPYLSRVDGVSEVAVIGGKIKEYHILLDPVKMSALGVTPQNVASVLSQNNFLTPNGYVSDYDRLYLSVTDAAIEDMDKLKNTIVKATFQREIRIKEIGTVEIAPKREYIKINANGKDVPLVAITKQADANLISVSRDVQDRVTELKKLLPPGVKLIPYYIQSDFVTDSIKSLKDVLWIGLLLAIIVTVFFLRSLKASSVVLLTIPVTLSLTLLLLYLFGYTYNIMTIGAVAAAVGLIIDDAIVVVEQIHRTHEEHPEESSFQLVNDAIKYLFPAMVGSSLSTIVIFFPFILMGGVAGAYFKVMTNTMMITLISSFFITWLGLPVIYLLFSREKHNVELRGKSLKQRAWVGYFIQRPWIAIGFSVLLIVITLIASPGIKSGFLPEMDEGSIVLDFKSPPGTSLEATDKMLQKVEEILKGTPEVDTFSRRLGTQMGFFITEPNTGDYLIQLKKNRNLTTDEVSDEIRKKIESTLPGLKVDFGQVVGDMLGDLMATTQPVEVKLFGDDQEQLKKLSKQVASIIESVPGTADVFDGITIAGPEMTVEPDIARLAQFNLSPSDFQFEVQNKIEGNVVGSMIEKSRLTSIRTLETDKKYVAMNDLKNTQIILPNGKLKPLGEFAGIKLKSGIAEVDRENLKTMIAVTARLNNRDLGSTLKEIQNKIKSSLTLPGGYTIEYGGAYKEQQTAFRELLFILIVASFLVFVVILFLFKKIKVALVIMILSVMGITGSLLALLITNTPLNVGSYTGIIMIVGIIGENSIFTYLQFREARKLSTKDESIIFSISTRLRPKLMTALCAISALFPLALGIGTGAQMHQPLAIAIIGGLLIALPLLLIVLPSVLRVIEK